MDNLIFVGGGGFFTEVHSYIVQDQLNGLLPEVSVKGIIDDNPDLSIAGVDYLGQIDDYQVQGHDLFIITIGAPLPRARIHALLSQQGGRFFTYIHPSSLVAPSASIAQGVILCPNTIVNVNAVVQANVAVNVFSSIGHDAQVNEHSVLSPYCAVNGNAKVGSECFLATRVTMFPGAELGDKSIVDCHGYVKGQVAQKHIVSVRGQYQVVKNRLI
jgi:UDP-3-O-[3-hydroxymyristoyl] glucosamine N-acyltransferase